MFISGGENIQPEEIEKYLCQIDGIKEAVVIPLKDAEFGMRPVAFIKGSIKNTKQLNRHLQKYLPKFKIPQVFYSLTSLKKY